MDIGKALTFITEDEKWIQKLGIGTGIILVSIPLSALLIGMVGFLIVMGYCVRLLQNVRDGHATPLPEWDQWSEDLARGFKLFLATFIWALPIIVLTIPMTVGGIMVDSGDWELAGGIILACGTCIALLYGLFIALSTPGITIAFARDEEIRSGLQLTEIWHWTRANLGSVIIVLLVWMAASAIISMVSVIAGLLLCGIGLLVTLPLGQLVTYLFQYHLFGQLAHEPNHQVQAARNPVWEDDHRTDSHNDADNAINGDPLSLPQNDQTDND